MSGPPRPASPEEEGQSGSAEDSHPGAETRRSRIMPPIRRFLQTEASGGALLLAATIIALVWANSPLSNLYEEVWHRKLTVGSGRWAISEDLRHWVNDALMTIFFFLIGLEIKREIVVGELHSVKALALPSIAALGGMLVPAAIYLAIAGGGELSRGWGIPMATDIAFAVGILSVLGSRVPGGLKIFLLTLAIIDDIGAIAVIALFYSSGIEVSWLLAAVGGLLTIVGLSRLGVGRPTAYIPVGVAVWYFTFRAGIHPTIAGVAIGLLTPAIPVGGRDVLQDLEHSLHPWSSYLIVPIFALANAGVDMGGGALRAAASSRLTWAVAAGLLVGKVVGISAATWAALRLRLGTLPEGIHMGFVAGAGGLGGIGFTVSLFIAALAFTGEALQTEAKIGILFGSVASGILGVAILLPQADPLVDADVEDADETGT